MLTDFQVPAEVSFQKAIALTQDLLPQANTLPPETLQTHIAALAATMNGARGFFVTFLTNDFALSNTAQDAVAQALCTSPDIVAELLVKNLVMSTAMTLTHRRQDNTDMAQQSQRTREQTAALIGQLQLSTVDQEAQHLWQSLTEGAGPYTEFLERWGYDAEQKQAMQTVLSQVFSHLQP